MTRDTNPPARSTPRATRSLLTTAMLLGTLFVASAPAQADRQGGLDEYCDDCYTIVENTCAGVFVTVDRALDVIGGLVPVYDSRPPGYSTAMYYAGYAAYVGQAYAAGGCAYAEYQYEGAYDDADSTVETLGFSVILTPRKA